MTYNQVCIILFAKSGRLLKVFNQLFWSAPTADTVSRHQDPAVTHEDSDGHGHGDGEQFAPPTLYLLLALTNYYI